MLKRFLTLLLALALTILPIAPVSGAAKADGIFLPVASGTVTQANMKISAVDGTAFIDFTAADVLTLKLGHLLRVRDSSGKVIQGFIKAAGTGETLGEALNVSNCVTWTGVLPYDTFDGVSPTAFHAVQASGAAAAGTADEMAMTAGWLMKLTFGMAKTSGDMPVHMGRRQFGDGEVYPVANSTEGANTKYYNVSTTVTGIVQFTTYSATEYTVSSLANKQVLTPSATGVTIAATKALAGTAAGAESWAQKDSSFNYNDASGYSYEILKVLTAPVVATDATIAAGELLCDSTTANAFIAPVGFDLSAYQDGKYIAHMTDSSGYVAFARIKGEAPGGETLDGTEKFTDSDFNDSGSWIIGTGWTVNSGGNGKAVSSGSNNNQFVRQAVSETIGKLYKITATLSAFTSGNFVLFFTGWNSGIFTGNGPYTWYWTAPDSGGGVSGLQASGTSAVAEFSSLSSQALTDCAATGALLTSDGTNRGFMYKHASWDPNKAQTVRILYVGD